MLFLLILKLPVILSTFGTPIAYILVDAQKGSRTDRQPVRHKPSGETIT